MHAHAVRLLFLIAVLLVAACFVTGLAERSLSRACCIEYQHTDRADKSNDFVHTLALSYTSRHLDASSRVTSAFSDRCSAGRRVWIDADPTSASASSRAAGYQ